MRMAEGKSRQQWAHTSEILAMLINTRAFGGKKWFAAEEFNPHEQRRLKEKKQQTMGTKEVFAIFRQRLRPKG